eukprot:3343934-Amphidinium_carterae.1
MESNEQNPNEKRLAHAVAQCSGVSEVQVLQTPSEMRSQSSVDANALRTSGHYPSSLQLIKGAFSTGAQRASLPKNCYPAPVFSFSEGGVSNSVLCGGSRSSRGSYRCL